MSASTLRAAIQASHSTASKPRTRPSCQRYVRINPSPESNLAPRDVENQHTVSTPEGNDKQRMRRAIPIAVIGLQQTLRARQRDGGSADHTKLRRAHGALATNWTATFGIVGTA